MIEQLAVAGSVAIIVVAVTYNSGMFLLSLGKPGRQQVAGSGRPRTYVFLLACLNEEKVIAESLERILALSDSCLALVVDDGSDDGTAAVVRGTGSARVHLLSRHLPNARKGKGAALNAGLVHLRESGLLGHRSADDVIICVVDADGRLDLHVLGEVDPYFDDPRTGAVQIGVRMYNRGLRLLARLQDMEFVVYGEVFQGGRQRIGSVGMGGNGQFMRLSALDSIRSGPWSASLTEDLDLGVRLLAEGWANRYCGTAAVHQQAVLTLGRLLRQRSRWFQGHMQAARLAPLILRRLPMRPAADLLYHLSSPALLLLTSLLPISFLIAMAGTVVASAQAGHSLLPLWWPLWFYIITFAIANAYGYVYRRREPQFGVVPSVLLGHLYVIYGYIWFVSGWWALGRTLSGRQSWLKTART